MASKHEIYKSQSIEESLTPPETPPELENIGKIVHPWPEPDHEPERNSPAKRRKIQGTKAEDFNVTHQAILLLHAPKQRYTHTPKQPIPDLKHEKEMLVRVEAVGLNPIDWKAPDFGWGLPALPCISGRDLAGTVAKPSKAKSRFQTGDKVMAISTDYRDSRKAAYQEYAVVLSFNACKLPQSLDTAAAAPLGVAFVAAALALGICLGVDFSTLRGISRGPDLLRIVRGLNREFLPRDIHAECFDGIPETERPKPGDWIAIWGGSAATGCCAVQLAKLAGLKVVAILDVARNGERMLKFGADLLVDRLDPERAIEILKGITKGKLRFGLDTRGKESALQLGQAMQTATEGREVKSHLVGLTGVPKEKVNGIVYHSVPIKAFHESPQVGEGMMIWLEKLLEQKLLTTPDIEIAEGGLAGINAALDRLRNGSVNGPRIVVPLTT